MQNLR